MHHFCLFNDILKVAHGNNICFAKYQMTLWLALPSRSFFYAFEVEPLRMQGSHVSCVIFGNGKPFLKFVLQDFGTKVVNYFVCHK